VNEPWELKYWSKKFGVPPEKIKEAVTAVGTSVTKVRQHFGV
jgi:hypothetical protein